MSPLAPRPSSSGSTPASEAFRPDPHDARSSADSLAALVAPWRVGTKVSRNIYAELPDGRSWLIGQMDTGQLARETVYRHNDALEARNRRSHR